MSTSIPARPPTWDLTPGDVVYAQISIQMILNEANRVNDPSSSRGGGGGTSVVSGRVNTTHSRRTNLTRATSSSQYTTPNYRKGRRPVIVLESSKGKGGTVKILAIASFGSDDIEAIDPSTSYWAVNLSPHTPTWPKNKLDVPRIYVRQQRAHSAFHKDFPLQYVICYPIDIPMTDLDSRSDTLQFSMDPSCIVPLKNWCKKLEVGSSGQDLKPPAPKKIGEFTYHSSASVITEHIVHRPMSLAYIPEDGDAGHPSPILPPSMDSPIHFPSLGAEPPRPPLPPRGLPTPRSNEAIVRLFNPKNIHNIFRKRLSKHPQEGATVAPVTSDVHEPTRSRKKHRAATIAY